MADEQHVLRSVSWSEVFSFSHIFKSFKMALHPSKLALALVAIALTYAVGTYVMDPIWRLWPGNTVRANEAWLLWYGWSDTPGQRSGGTRDAFRTEKRKWVNDTRVSELAGLLQSYPAKFRDPYKTAREDFSKSIGELNRQYLEDYRQDLKSAEKSYLEDQKTAEGKTDKKQRKQAERDAALRHAERRAVALNGYVGNRNGLKALTGPGIFGGFLSWQDYCLSNALVSVRRGNFVGGLSLLCQTRASATPEAYANRSDTNAPPISASATPPEGFGLVCWLVLMIWGVWWLMSTYPVYAVIYIVLALATWSLLGGAICRIAALHAARDEKIGINTALRFAVTRFFSFFSAPLLPLAIIVSLGLVLVAGGLFGLIPYAGEWFVGLLFFVALGFGMLMAFLTVGLVGGGPLMWPTIAVEGSDSFDAISRSFSYLFTKPFRYGLYWAVAAAYGTACYLFVRLFAFVSLRSIHHWAGWAMGLWWGSRDGYALGAGKLHVMWPEPTFSSFTGPLQTEAMDVSETLAACFLNFWVYVVSGLVIAFLICLFFSASTCIYCLMRRRVDATDLDDVYVEEPGEEAEAETGESAPRGETPAEPADEKPASDQPAQPE